MGMQKDKILKLLIGIVACCPELIANPEDPAVAEGKATFSAPQQHILEVAADRNTVIHWKDFSIAKGEVTRFIQPAKEAVVVNRVTGGRLSSLMGTLEANGKLFLLNPAGVLIGKDAIIRTAAFTASTLDALDSAMLEGSNIQFFGDSKATVINLGKIFADDGDVFLIANKVANHGEIHAPKGHGALGGAQELIVQLDGEERIGIRPKMSGAETDVQNSGTIDALCVEMKAEGNPFAMAVNHTGSIQALGIKEEGGRVFLRAEKGNVSVSKDIVAHRDNGKGGEVQILVDGGALLDNARIDISGIEGGGQLLLGGDFQGKNPNIPNAQTTYVGEGVLIDVDAKIMGDGGRVIVWADDTTRFYGSISARGGVESGNGGFVEVSGKQHLDYRGVADRMAPMGKAGSLLLDPTSLTIGLADANITAAPIFQPATPLATSQLSVATLSAALTGGDVYVQTIGNNGNGNGDLVWVDSADLAIAPGTPANLFLNSVRDIVMNSAYTNNTSGNFTAQAARDVIITSVTKSSPGVTLQGGKISLTGASISLLAVTNPVSLTSNSGSAQDAIELTALSGNILLETAPSSGSVTITSNGAPITLTSHAQDILINGIGANASITSGSNITLTSKGNLLLTGGVSTAQVATNQQLYVNAGGNCILQGVGTGPATLEGDT